ncbi:MAG: FtsH protease activity modulator HflK [Morganella sp. (in: enterobacteria)]
MAWNQPGNNGQDRDPWGSSNKGGNSDGNKSGRNRGASDLDDLFRKMSRKLGGLGGGKGGNNNGQSGGNSRPPMQFGGGRLLGLAAAAVVVVWAATGFYTIKETERGVVTRFGKFSHVVQPGLNWRPTFIDRVTAVDVATVQDLATNGMMLTADENVVRVNMNVQFQVVNPEDYLFSVTNPNNSLRQAMDSAVRGVIGKFTMEKILTANRTVVRNETQKVLEETIRPYKMGIAIVDVNFQEARPPAEVQASFDDVIAARENEQQSIREAEAYSNEVLPLAKGNAQSMIEGAQAYKASIVLKARGEVASFAKMLPEYRAAPDITRERLYIETMERVLSNTRKVIANDKSNSMMVLPLDQLMREQRAAAPSAPSASVPSAGTPSKPASRPAQNSSQNPNVPAEYGDTYGVRGNSERVGRQ